MSRIQLTLILLTMPLWVGIGLLLWMRNPLLIIIPCGTLIGGILVMVGLLAYAAKLRTGDVRDLVIRRILHRFGFEIAPPKRLTGNIGLDHTHDEGRKHNSLTKDDS